MTVRLCLEEEPGRPMNPRPPVLIRCRGQPVTRRRDVALRLLQLVSTHGHQRQDALRHAERVPRFERRAEIHGRLRFGGRVIPLPDKQEPLGLKGMALCLTQDDAVLLHEPAPRLAY